MVAIKWEVVEGFSGGAKTIQFAYESVIGGKERKRDPGRLYPARTMGGRITWVRRSGAVLFEKRSQDSIVEDMLNSTYPLI